MLQVLFLIFFFQIAYFMFPLILYKSQPYFSRHSKRQETAARHPFLSQKYGMRKRVSFCRLQANRLKETPFLELPYHFVCIFHRMKGIIAVNFNDHFHACCTALEKTRYKKHGQAILFFHRNFSDGCAIFVCDYHFLEKNARR